jgi:hypothetical protein
MKKSHYRYPSNSVANTKPESVLYFRGFWLVLDFSSRIVVLTFSN